RVHGDYWSGRGQDHRTFVAEPREESAIVSDFRMWDSVISELGVYSIFLNDASMAGRRRSREPISGGASERGRIEVCVHLSQMDIGIDIRKSMRRMQLRGLIHQQSRMSYTSVHECASP